MYILCTCSTRAAVRGKVEGNTVCMCVRVLDYYDVCSATLYSYMYIPVVLVRCTMYKVELLVHRPSYIAARVCVCVRARSTTAQPLRIVVYTRAHVHMNAR